MRGTRGRGGGDLSFSLFASLQISAKIILVFVSLNAVSLFRSSEYRLSSSATGKKT